MNSIKNLGMIFAPWLTKRIQALVDGSMAQSRQSKGVRIDGPGSWTVLKLENRITVHIPMTALFHLVVYFGLDSL